MEFWPFVYWTFAFAGLAALAGGYLGRWHPAGDSLAVFRGHLGLAGIVWFLAGAALGLAPGWSVALPILALVPVLAARLRPERAGPVTLYQKNMSYQMPDVAPLAADIRAVAPDLLTLQEVTPANAVLLQQLADILPHTHLCRFEHVGGIAIASRWPILPGSLRCAHGLAAAQLDTPEGPLWLVSLHLHWPWPDRQPIQHPQILEVLDGLDGPVVLAGDFNMVRWSYSVQSIARAIRAEPAGRARTTFRIKRAIGIAIDQILVPSGRRGATETRPMLGSDHLGFVARF
ncbi:endonuclease/exonuclease/phosphatase family protein [Tropicimonas sp. IMCC34043]|uniref:endonuclease/exonuclease/phosphatase family protein n=1 Tax=Tropicimonas sp. IMCC34043 TaxID=2248760 RepID=UPI00130047B4|nr:endonuclease/exonuclease/phosphatase family protein [Tropicimonas sp. IMCC34043]